MVNFKIMDSFVCTLCGKSFDSVEYCTMHILCYHDTMVVVSGDNDAIPYRSWVLQQSVDVEVIIEDE